MREGGWQPLGGKCLIFLAGVVVSSVFFINFCAFVFQCGCQLLWSGADIACNIHRAGVRHCPWCEYHSGWAYGAIVGSQAIVAFWPKRISWWIRGVGALSAFPLTGSLMALIYGIRAGYWSY